MAESVHPPIVRVADKGNKEAYTGKSVEYRGGARRALGTADEIFEHFNRGATIPAGFTLREEGTTTAAATYGTGLGGTAVITSDDVAAKTDSLNTTGLLWQCDRQPTGVPLVYEAKLKLNTKASGELWVGFSDASDDTDPYALSLTSTFTTSVPTDAAVIGYSDTPTSGAAFTSGGNQHTALSTINNTDAVVATSGGAFVEATYYTYRVELSATGDAVYFVDGKFVGKKVGAITKTVPLAGICYVAPRTTSSRALTIDYIYIGGV